MNFDEFDKQFATSDLHFFHKNIIKYCPDSRGHLESVDDMNEQIVERWNSKVGENDHTFILGDLTFGKPGPTMELLALLNGYKTLIHGNHDRSLLKSHEFQNDSIRRGAGLIEDTPYKVISQKVDGVNVGVVMFHFRIASWDGMHHGSVHLYGHEHAGGPKLPIRCQDIGVDTNNMYPYEMVPLLRDLVKRPIHKEGHHDGSRE